MKKEDLGEILRKHRHPDNHSIILQHSSEILKKINQLFAKHHPEIHLKSDPLKPSISFEEIPDKEDSISSSGVNTDKVSKIHKDEYYGIKKLRMEQYQDCLFVNIEDESEDSCDVIDSQEFESSLEKKNKNTPIPK